MIRSPSAQYKPRVKARSKLVAGHLLYPLASSHHASYEFLEHPVLIGVAMRSRSLPGARALAAYRHAWLPHDIVAGLVLVTLLVPQGMAYAELAGLPAITGLYTSVTCLLAYAAFGPSRILVLGPDSALG